eukprot:scaffold2856_cov189-Alexandrium_tamarense.AAC.6
MMASNPSHHLPLVLLTSTICGVNSFSLANNKALTQKALLLTNINQHRRAHHHHYLSVRKPSSSNWDDEFASSRSNAEVADYLPPWRAESETKESFQTKSNMDFRRPHGTPPPSQPPPKTAKTEQFHYKEGFQFQSTDDFRKPYDGASRQPAITVSHTVEEYVPSSSQPPPPTKENYKEGFQFQSADEFRRPSQGTPGGGSSQPITVSQSPVVDYVPPSQPPPKKEHYKEAFQFQTTDQFRKPSDGTPGGGSTPTNIVSGSSAMPQEYVPPSQPPPKKQHYKEAFQFQSTDDFRKPSDGTPGGGSSMEKSQSTAVYSPISPQRDILGSPDFVDPIPSPPSITQHYSRPKVRSQIDSNSASTYLRGVKWPVHSDPLGVSPEFPLLLTRSTVTILSALATWYLHLFNGCSPVLASSAITLLVSTCVERRLGQAALCGTLAGMSGGHLAPNFGTAVLLGVLASINYEVLIHMKNFCLGIGGRLGATAFLATSVVAKYRRVGSVGRKLRRGIWKSGAGGLSSVMITMMVFHAIGAVATICLRESSDDVGAADPVQASSVIGLMGAICLSNPTAIMALYGGSFVGMALPSRLMHGSAPGKARISQPHTPVGMFTSFAVAGALAGAIHGMTIHWGYWNGGWGGKIGLCAFAGCWLYRGFGNALAIVRNGKR